MKVCIEPVEGGFSVYVDQGPAAPMAPPDGESMPQPGMDAGGAAGGAAGGQVAATVDEALQLAGSMLGGAPGTEPQQDDGSAEALFQSGFKSATKQ